jgi:hypothetical protein
MVVDKIRSQFATKKEKSIICQLTRISAAKEVRDIICFLRTRNKISIASIQ